MVDGAGEHDVASGVCDHYTWNFARYLSPARVHEGAGYEQFFREFRIVFVQTDMVLYYRTNYERVFQVKEVHNQSQHMIPGL